MAEHRKAFSFDLLTGAATRRDPLTVCPNGHLVVADKSHWRPDKFDHTLARIDCVRVDRSDCD